MNVLILRIAYDYVVIVNIVLNGEKVSKSSHPVFAYSSTHSHFLCVFLSFLFFFVLVISLYKISI